MEMQGMLWRGAMAALPGLLGQIGEAAGDWTARPLAQREDAVAARIVLRLDGPGGALVLKHQARPAAGFAEEMAALLHIQDRWPQGVACLRAVDLEARACLMDHLDATPLSVLLDAAAPAGRVALMRRAGAWLDGFHRAFPGRARQFQPKYTVRYLHEVIAQTRAGQRAMPDRHRFLALADVVLSQAPAFEGQGTAAALSHGDLHQRNLLLDDARCWGIDAREGREIPVGHDIARLLIDHAILHGDTGAMEPGTLLPGAILDGFFDGYRVAGRDDPSIGLLMRNRLLAEWWALPPAGRSLAQDRRWRGVSALARVFAGV